MPSRYHDPDGHQYTRGKETMARPLTSSLDVFFVLAVASHLQEKSGIQQRNTNDTFGSVARNMQKLNLARRLI